MAALPVSTERFRSEMKPSDTYFLMPRLVHYRWAELIVRAFAATPERRLIIIGDGPKHDRVNAAAAESANIDCI